MKKLSLGAQGAGTKISLSLIIIWYSAAPLPLVCYALGTENVLGRGEGGKNSAPEEKKQYASDKRNPGHVSVIMYKYLLAFIPIILIKRKSNIF